MTGDGSNTENAGRTGEANSCEESSPKRLELRAAGSDDPEEVRFESLRGNLLVVHSPQEKLRIGQVGELRRPDEDCADETLQGKVVGVDRETGDEGGVKLTLLLDQLSLVVAGRLVTMVPVGDIQRVHRVELPREFLDQIRVFHDPERVPDTVVRDEIRRWKQQTAEVFMPLSHPPGEAQFDFGEAKAIYRNREIKVMFCVMSLPYSDAFFCQAFPRECTETFQEGHVRAFNFFGGVPRELLFDQMKAVIVRTAKELSRPDGSYIKFDENAAAGLQPLRRPGVEEPPGRDHDAALLRP